MARPVEAPRARLFVAALWADADALARAVTLLAEHFGPIDFQGPDHSFDLTDYYEGEMGPDLRRRLLSFARLVQADALAPGKLQCNAIEGELSGPRGRRVNLDLGLLDHHKLLLASLKGAGQKIYLQDGVYADLQARFRNNRYEPFEWAFPDFKQGRYDPELQELRRRFLAAIRSAEQG